MRTAISSQAWKAFGGVAAALAVGISLQTLYHAQNEKLVQAQMQRLQIPEVK